MLAWGHRDNQELPPPSVSFLCFCTGAIADLTPVLLFSMCHDISCSPNNIISTAASCIKVTNRKALEEI